MYGRHAYAYITGNSRKNNYNTYSTGKFSGKGEEVCGRKEMPVKMNF
jgi:hypothetical protein